MVELDCDGHGFDVVVALPLTAGSDATAAGSCPLWLPLGDKASWERMYLLLH